MRPSQSTEQFAVEESDNMLLEHLRRTPRLSAAPSAQRSASSGAALGGFSLDGGDRTAPAAAGAPPARTEAPHSSSPLAPAATILGSASSAGAGAESPVADDPLLSLTASILGQAGENVVDDSFSQCFEEHSVKPWNWNVYLYPCWLLGVVFRYLVLFPVRVLLMAIGLFLFFSGFIAVKLFAPILCMDRVAAERRLTRFLCSVFVMSWSGVIRVHGVRPPQVPGRPALFVANHSSMIDFIILQQSHNYSVIGQKHKGWVAFFQDYVLGALQPIWFDRAESKNRAVVRRRLVEHAHDTTRPPILVFPEGTCVNNRHIIQFKKTVFDLGVQVNPIAIKYNPVFVSGYWNSRRISFAGHLVDLMCSWAVVCDVWFLDPMTMREGEDAVAFARRVQHAIAAKAKLRPSDWDGYMKYWKPSARFLLKRRQDCAEALALQSGMEWPAGPQAPPVPSDRMSDDGETEEIGQQLLDTSSMRRRHPRGRGPAPRIGERSSTAPAVSACGGC